MAIVISGFDLSKNLRDQMKMQVTEFPSKFGRTPHLVVFLIGNNPASMSYVSGKEKACLEIGMRCTVIRLEETTSEDSLLEMIKKNNDDVDVDGILVQLPLPKHINEHKVLYNIAFEKDVDGFHPMNVAKLHLQEPCLLPCTPKGIITMLKSQGISIKGKNAVVVGRSNLVGKPVAQLLLNENATVTICHSRTVDLASYTRNADVLIAAVGRPMTITADMIKPGAAVIDVGVNRVDGHLCGDVDFQGCLDKAGYITPVPKGVGPMTITSLMENTIEAFLRRVGNQND